MIIFINKHSFKSTSDELFKLIINKCVYQVNLSILFQLSPKILFFKNINPNLNSIEIENTYEEKDLFCLIRYINGEKLVLNEENYKIIHNLSLILLIPKLLEITIFYSFFIDQINLCLLNFDDISIQFINNNFYLFTLTNNFLNISIDKMFKLISYLNNKDSFIISKIILFFLKFPFKLITLLDFLPSSLIFNDIYQLLLNSLNNLSIVEKEKILNNFKSLKNFKDFENKYIINNWDLFISKFSFQIIFPSFLIENNINISNNRSNLLLSNLTYINNEFNINPLNENKYSTNILSI